MRVVLHTGLDETPTQRQQLCESEIYPQNLHSTHNHQSFETLLVQGVIYGILTRMDSESMKHQVRRGKIGCVFLKKSY